MALMTDHWRKHGSVPYQVAILHGGPGAAGEMVAVAKELGKKWGVFEPFQQQISVNGQVEELRAQLLQNTRVPVALVGYSWGAWLGWMLAAKYPLLVRKLVLVSSGAFAASYAAQIMSVRKSRLSVEEQREVDTLLEMMRFTESSKKRQLNDRGEERKVATSVQADAQSRPSRKTLEKDEANRVLARFGALMSKADLYCPLAQDEASDPLDCQLDIFNGVWPEASALRESGELLNMGRQIRCPVVAIHGDYDSSPAQGVVEPLAAVLADFQFILLKQCGHTPWREQKARSHFYQALFDALRK